MTPQALLLSRATETSESPMALTMSRVELARFFAELGFVHGAEIGVWQGEYAQTLFKQNPRLRLVAVDPWAPQSDYFEKKNDAAVLRKAFVEAQSRLRSYACELWRMTSLEGAARVPDGSLDFVYIDGNHRYEAVTADITAWEPKVRRGGIVAGHDFVTRTKRHIDVERAVRDYTKANGIAPWFTTYKGTSDLNPSWLWVKT